MVEKVFYITAKTYCAKACSTTLSSRSKVKISGAYPVDLLTQANVLRKI